MSGAVWVDVSTVLNDRRSRVHGVARFVLETTESLSEHPEVRFFRLDRNRNRFVAVNEHELASKRRKSDSPKEFSLGSGLGGKLRMRLLKTIEDRLRTNKSALAYARMTRSLLQGNWRLVSRRLSIPRVLFAAIPAPNFGAHTCMSQSWGASDIVCHLGFWNHLPDQQTIDKVANLRKEIGLKVARVIFDIIPVSRPQFTGNPETSFIALNKLLSSTDLFLAISSHTKLDVERYCSSAGKAAPPTTVIRMASTAVSETLQRPDGFDDSNPFILCVGTIEIRKNHHLLFDVWESFLADLPPNRVPTLVIAGSLGWLNTETVTRLRWTPGFDTVVRFIENPTDAELSWLYSHCQFTVYPSLFEGWGYPITESLDAGKVCVTSNVSSMPEAAEGLGILLDPRDRSAWRSTIERLAQNPDELRSMESAIRERHVRVTPADVADDIWSALSSLRSKDPSEAPTPPTAIAESAL